jgi:transposase
MVNLQTYIHSFHTTKKSWSVDTPQGCVAPTSTGQRIIIVHAGTEKGFIPGAFLVFKSNQTTADYHKEINSNNYLRWVQEKLSPNLPQNSVFVIDNAAYHNVLSEKCPTSSSRKEDMENWLLKNKIPFSGDLLKTELYTLIALHKPRRKRCILDDLLSAQGHTVLRLPPYHPDLITIENIWGDVKQSVRQRNVTFKLDDVWQLCKQRFADISDMEWAAVCRHVMSVEEQYICTEGLMEPEVERLMFSVSGRSNSGDSSSSYSESDATMDVLSSSSDMDDALDGIAPLE